MTKTILVLSINLCLASFALLAQPSLCTNCPNLTKVKNRSHFDAQTYYQNSFNADSTDASAFKYAVHRDINQTYRTLRYREIWTALTYTDEDPKDPSKIRLIYKNTAIAKQHNGSGKHSTQQNYWNREHIWPKSHGFPKKSQQGYTDLHHLKPADVSMNTQRSDNDFLSGGQPVKEAPLNRKNKSYSFEPHDTVKGDIARMIFYMDVMYEADSHHDMPDLEIVKHSNSPRTDLTSGIGQIGDLCTLYQWHFLDPVDAFEINRNNTIYEFQANRNPFIDNPDWVKVIYQSDCDSV